MVAHTMSSPNLSSQQSRPGIPTLFFLCLKIGLFSFGGGLTGWVYQEFVLRTRLLEEDDFSSSLAISQMLPGANVVNLAICIGEQLRGPLGSIACFLGILVGPFFAVIALYGLFDAFSSIEELPVFFNGVAFAAIGLLLLTCLHGIRGAMRFPPSIFVIVLTTVLVGILEWPLIPVVAAVAPLSVALAWMRR